MGSVFIREPSGDGQGEVMTIDLVENVRLLWKHKIVIILLALLGAAVMYVNTAFFTDDTYTAYGVLHISNKTEKDEVTDGIQKSDIETSKTLSSTYIEILKTRVFLKDISTATGEKYNWEKIEKMLTISTVNDTELLKIAVKSTDRDDAYLLADTIMEKAPAKLMSVYKTGEVEIVDPAQPPARADGRGMAGKLMIGFIIGTALGVGYAFLYAFLDKKVHSSEEVARRYGLSILGETAQIWPVKKNGRDEKYEKAEEKIINAETDFDTVETYKSIRTNIMFSIPQTGEGKVIVVTSASPSEGKTTTTINLAITFAQTGAKVIVVDCDLRKSRVHRYLGQHRDDGVSNVVCGYIPVEKAIKRNVREGLDVLTAGEIPPNPAELLESTAFGELIAELKENYDYIFIDSPPVTVVTDAAILMKLATGVVVVVRQEATTYDLLDEAVEELHRTDAKVLGVIVHDSNEKFRKYGYYRKGKYGYKYGYKYKYGYRYNYRYGDEPKKKADDGQAEQA